MTVTVYMRPDCERSQKTLRDLESHGVEFELIDLSRDHQAVETIRGLGYFQTPVVVTDEDHWSGNFQFKVKALAERLKKKGQTVAS